MRILVTGGTGKTGRRVVARLRALGHEPVVASRAGENGVKFDWNRPECFAAASRAIDAAYLVAPSGAFDLVPVMQPFIEALLHAGVGRLVLLGAAALPMGGPLMGAVHAWLAGHAPRWTVLRPSWFMQNFSEQQHLETIVAQSAIYSAADDGRIGWIDADDIAAVAATVLVDRQRDNGEVILTGPSTLNYDDVAVRLSDAIGRSITHRRLTVAQLAARYTTAGLPPDYAQTLADMDGAIAAGSADFVTGEVKQATGKQPASFDEFAARNVACWRQRT